LKTKKKDWYALDELKEMVNKKPSFVDNLVYYFWDCPIEWLKDLPRRIKHGFQKLYKGYGDNETWSLDYEIAKFTYKRLKRFKELDNGHPGDLTWEEWDKCLDKMIKAFSFFIREQKGKIDYSDYSPEQYKKLWAKHQKGFELFGKYFNSLWW